MKKSIAFICLFLFLFASCDKVTEERIRSYIVAFYTPKGMELTLTEDGAIKLFWICQKNEFPLNDPYLISFKSEGEDAARYDSLCVKHSDLSYNKISSYTVSYPSYRTFSTADIVSIDVVSDKIFDEHHPAGSSLNDVVQLFSVSPKRFIRSNYKEYYDWVNQRPSEFPDNLFASVALFPDIDYVYKLHPVIGFLDGLKPDDMQLLGTGGGMRTSEIENPDLKEDPSGFNYIRFFSYLKFEEPSNPGEHELTITIRLDDGRTISQSITKMFGDNIDSQGSHR